MKYLKFNILTFIILIIFIAAANASTLSPEEKKWLHENKTTIRLCPDPYAPPLDFFDEWGNYRGLTADYVHLLEKKLNIKFKIIRADSWKQGLQ